MALYYRIKRWFASMRYSLKCGIQRFKYGYAYGDVYDMDLWFVRTIKQMLTHLRDNGCSYPMQFKDRDAWCVVLDEMISCLHMMDEDNAHIHVAFGEVGAYKEMTHEDRQKAYELMRENKNRFFELFNKYFYDLWD